jgi:hypothetical protein
MAGEKDGLCFLLAVELSRCDFFNVARICSFCLGMSQLFSLGKHQQKWLAKED